MFNVNSSIYFLAKSKFLEKNEPVNHKSSILCLFFFITFFELFLNHGDACANMRDEYPKRFSFFGLAELTYKDYSSGTNGGNSNYSSLEDRYSLGVRGYIYHPKLAVFTAQVTFDDNRGLSSTSNPASSSMDYSLFVTFLPYRPVSLTAYATRTDYTGFASNGVTAMNYGGVLSANLKGLPSIRVEYDHSDVTSNLGQQTSSDFFYLNVRGYSEKLKTQYGLNFGLSNTKGQDMNMQAKFISVSTDTHFKKFSLSNFFQYMAQEGQESSKLFGIYSNLIFTQSDRFFHEYYYTYEHIEDTINNVKTGSDRHEIRGIFNYRILSNLSSALLLNYGLLKDDAGHFSYYAVNVAFNYSRAIKSLYLVSYYRFILRNDEELGNFTEHELKLDLTTRKLKWGRMYASYNLSMLDGTFNLRDNTQLQNVEGLDQTGGEVLVGKYNTITHSLVLGLRGNAFRTASWSIESEYVNSSSNKVRPKANLGFDDSDQPNIVTEMKSNYYIFVGEFMYPFGKRGSTLALRTGYNIGESDSKKVNRYYYEIKAALPVSRRLQLLAWWRQSWYKIEGTPNTNVREYNILANYRIGRVYLSAEYWVRDEDEPGIKTQNTRLMVKAKRYF